MRGDITLNILESLAANALGMKDIIAGILTAGYGASFSGMQYQINKQHSAREKRNARKAKEQQIRQRYYSLIYNLKNDGLIAEKTVNNKKILVITTNGLNKIKKLRANKDSAFPATNYDKEGSSNLIIIIFDIPERERTKRAWLREALKKLGMKMIQQSVWLGKTKMPRQFLKDLADLKLVNFVEIFEITKTGSMKHLV